MFVNHKWLTLIFRGVQSEAMSAKLNRYDVQNTEFQGQPQKAIYLKEREEAGNRAFVVQGLATTVKEVRKKAHQNNVVYLDGACQGPYYDPMHGKFSLDHHDDCVRQITDASCVQAMNLARTRVIRSEGYQIAGNDPDLDTVLAAWALLNADELAYDDRLFTRMQPLFLLQGNIDALGLGHEELTGLSSDQIRQSRQRINWLMREERDIKSRGRWQTSDFVDYTEGTLRKVDDYAYYADQLDVPVDLTAHEVLDLENGQQVHYALAPHSGIYEVENTIVNHEQQKDCACVIFHDGRAKWTVKLSGFVNGFDLAPVFSRLDELETEQKQAKRISDDRLLNAHWGGGNTIGGPPRYHTGIGPFVPRQRILDVVQEELNKQLDQ